MKKGVSGRSLRKSAIGCALALCFVLLKNVPWIGATPWACAAVDAALLLLLLLLSGRYGALLALPVALLAPPIDWLQGSLAGFLIPFAAVGYVLALVLWQLSIRWIAVKAALCALAATVPPILGTAVGYMALKSLGASEALRTALRSRWYVILWFASACALAAFIETRHWMRAGKFSPETNSR